MISIEEIFDRVLASEEGEFVVIKCENYDEMERVRMRLYREMRKLKRAHKGLFDGLSISRQADAVEKKYVVYLSKSPEIESDRVLFFSKNGRVEPFEKEKTNGKSKLEEVEQPQPSGKGTRKIAGGCPSKPNGEK